MNHWIAVADSEVCRIYRSDETMERWTMVQVLTNPRLRTDGGDLGPRGSTQAGPGLQKSAMDRHTDPVDAERQRFAREVAQVLDEAFGRGEWNRLVLAAPPKFLGLLRGELSSRVSKATVAAIHHDFVRTSEHELPGAVRRHMPTLAGLE